MEGAVGVFYAFCGLAAFLAEDAVLDGEAAAFEILEVELVDCLRGGFGAVKLNISESASP